MDEKRLQVTEDQVLAALAEVRDPDHGENIVALGWLRGLVLRDGNVGFSIEVEAARGPALEGLRREAEDKVIALPGVVSVTAVVTAERPGGASQTTDGATNAAPGAEGGEGGRGGRAGGAGGDREPAGKGGGGRAIGGGAGRHKGGGGKTAGT